jgi:glutamine amidotransferase
MGTVVVVDVGIGNLRSVQKALERAASDAGSPGSENLPIRTPIHRQGGRPARARFRLRHRLAGSRRRHPRTDRQGTLFGICMGAQTLFRTSDEAPGYEGLGIFEGKRAPPSGERDPPRRRRVKIPHMGWNAIELRGGGIRISTPPAAARSYVHPTTRCRPIRHRSLRPHDHGRSR